MSQPPFRPAGGSGAAADAQPRAPDRRAILCLAGGVALNCVANGKVLRDGRFDRLWIQPAAGDAAGAVGAALAALHQFKGGPRSIAATDGMSGAFLGPQFLQSEIERRLAACGARFAVLGEDDMIEATAKALSDQLAVGWFQGRMEFGPRSLGGARSSAIPVRQPCKEPQSQGEVP